MAPTGFDDQVRLSDGRQSVVYRARRSSDSRRVILKVLRGPRPSPEAQARFQAEYQLTRLAAGPGSVDCLELDDGDEPTLVLVDVGATSLDQVVADGPLEVADVLAIARQVAETLARIHDLGVIHKDVCPANLVWNRSTGAVELIDFGIASRLQRHEVAEASSDALLGTLAYLAPEQSGRMNRSVDSRSDLYALGATLYHLLCGRPPFTADDPLDVIHAHIARQPDRVDAVRPEVPAALADIIDRLLMKGADDRYQSADGLAADLLRCAERFAGGDGSSFDLGTDDGPSRLLVPEHLYGRDRELDELLQAFERVRSGRCELLLVGGWAGIGKTRLVNELRPAMLETRAFYVEGKHDQFQRGTPYAAILAALGRLLRSVLGEPDAEVARWRDLLVDAAGEQLPLLVEVVPEAAMLVGDQPPAAALPPAEAEARFAFLLRRLLRAMAAWHPLVVFLDDLQWADLPSMHLLQALVTDPAATGTLLVGAYRSNDVDSGHPLLTLVDDLAAEGGTVRTISLGPLAPSDVRQLVADTLQREPDEVADLADRLAAKSGGNPFFLVRLLGSLGASGVIARDRATHRWGWSLDALDAVALTDNVVDLLTGVLVGLDPGTQRALGIGALLGERFGLREVAEVAGWTLSEAAQLIEPALLGDLVSRVDGSLVVEGLVADDLDASIAPTYRFAHDRVQQAARELLSEADVTRLHLAIARRLRSRDASGAELFDLVEHALAAADLLHADERPAFARLAATAGERASGAAAFDPALRYFDGAWGLLGTEPWVADHGLAREVALGGAEAAYLVDAQDRIDHWTAEVIDHCGDLESVLRAHDIVVQALNARNDLVPAIERAVEALRLVGVKLPADPSQRDILQGLVQTKLALRKVSPDELRLLPNSTDPVVLASLRLQMRISESAYYARPNLLPLLAFSMVRTTLRSGVAAESPFGFSVWGLVLCSLGQIDKGVEAGQLAMHLNERSDVARMRHRATHLYNAHLRLWKEHWRLSRDDLRDNYRACWDGGDLTYAAFGAFMSTTMALYVGDPLADVAQAATDFAEAIRHLQNDTTLQTILMNEQLARCLLGDAPDPTRLRGAAYDESAMLDVHTAANDQTNLLLRCLYGAHLAYLFGDPGRAAGLLAEADEHKGAAASTVYSIFQAYLAGLVNAAVAAGSGSHARAALGRAGKARRSLAKWETHAPHNVRHRVALVDAEVARAKGDEATAIHRYEEAIGAARDHGWWADLALANELAGRYHLGLGHPAIGRGYLLEARHHYESWGAVAKVDALDAEFTAVLQGATTAQDAGATSRGGTVEHTTDLDTVALFGAASAISGEVEVDGVVAALVRLSIEVGGASRGLLAVVDDADALRVRAVASADLVVERVDSPVEAFPLLVGAVAYAARSLDDVVIDDATTSIQYRSDPHVVATEVRSVAVVPVVLQQRLLAVLYLENGLTPHAFPQARLEVLRALAAQTAISLRNAELYERLEDQVRHRTSQLLDARQEAEVQRDRADSILDNVLPEAIAAELKRTGRARPVAVPSATVLFTDCKGFTELSATLSAEELVAVLARVFTAFDRICDRRGVEKLKTIGDSYMAVGGLPIRTDTHVVDVVRAALDMVAYVRDGDEVDGRPPFEIRVGVHTGSLVAGVIGERRFLYDVWGDTVNVASRMESSGEPGRVNVSAATRALLPPSFRCTPRGLVEAKGKGKLEMFFVDGEDG